jgi:hypothetical protein
VLQKSGNDSEFFPGVKAGLTDFGMEMHQDVPVVATVVLVKALGGGGWEYLLRSSQQPIIKPE